MDTTSLPTLVEEQLAAARASKHGRAASTVHGGQGRALRQTLLALAAGHSLADHESPGEATLYVLHGKVRLTTGTANWEGSAGDHVAIPPERHGLEALDDSAVLLTIATSA